MAYLLIQILAILFLLFRIDFTYLTTYHYFALILVSLIGIIAVYNIKLDNFNALPELKQNHKLITTGIYKYIRHPIYTSILLFYLIIVISPINKINILVYLILITILYLKSNKEEFYLIGKFKEYKIYKKNTGRFFPKIK